MKLSTNQQGKAREFVVEQARPLERSRFAFHFEQGSADDVLAQLAHFQNCDGGFGHALEPDLRTPASSAIATSVAFQILREVRAQEDCPLVAEGIRFLLNTYDRERKVWQIITPEANESPHAPWWHYGEDRPLRWKEGLANPRPEIVAYLLQYRNLVAADLLESLLEDVIAHLDVLPEQMDMHDLLCYTRLLGTEALPESAKSSMLGRLRRAAESTVAKTEADWGSYGLKPVVLAPSPESPFAEMLHDATERNLDYDIEHQQPDGSWSTTWSWPGDAWQDAQREWKGVLTLRMLLALRSYGRLE